MDELEKLHPQEMTSDPLPVEKLLEPFQVLVVKSPTKTVRLRSKDLLLDGRLAAWGFEKAPGGEKKKQNIDENEGNEDVEMGDDDEEWGGIDG